MFKCQGVIEWEECEVVANLDAKYVAKYQRMMKWMVSDLYMISVVKYQGVMEW